MNKIDLHCHILPYVDDGAEDIDVSISLLKEEARQGVRLIVATPHLRKGMFETPDEEIVRRFKQLKEAASVAQIPVNLLLSREYHWDKSYIQSVNSGSIFPYVKDPVTMLTEFSSVSTSDTMLHAVKELARAGIRPLIAHIERCMVTQDDPEGTAELLIKNGALLQVNAGSILGWEGRRQKKTAAALIKAGSVFAVASDCHDMEGRRPNLEEAEKLLEKKYGRDAAHALLYENPLKLLKGEHR